MTKLSLSVVSTRSAIPDRCTNSIEISVVQQLQQRHGQVSLVALAGFKKNCYWCWPFSETAPNKLQRSPGQAHHDSCKRRIGPFNSRVPVNPTYIYLNTSIHTIASAPPSILLRRRSGHVAHGVMRRTNSPSVLVSSQS